MSVVVQCLLSCPAVRASSLGHILNRTHSLIRFGRAEPLRNHVRFSPMPSEHDWRTPATSASPRSSSPVRIELDPSSSNGDLLDNANPNLSGVDPARAKWAQKGTDAHLCHANETRQPRAGYVVDQSLHARAALCFLILQQDSQSMHIKKLLSCQCPVYVFSCGASFDVCSCRAVELRQHLR